MGQAPAKHDVHAGLFWVGLAGLTRLLSPTTRVMAYGFAIGSIAGLFVYIDRDLRRLGRGTPSRDTDLDDG